MKPFWKCFVISVLTACVTILALLFIGMYRMLDAYHKKQNDYTRSTSPLTVEVQRDVCEKFDIPETDRRCQSEYSVYAAEFRPEIASYLHSLRKEERSFELVQEKLGDYLYLQGMNGSYAFYIYDLRGDGVYTIVVVFDPNGFIHKFMISHGGS